MSSSGAAPPPPQWQGTIIPIENSRQVAMLVTSAFAMIIPTILVGLRFYAGHLIHRKLDASDACILAALIFTIGLHVDMYVMVLRGGFGFHGQEIVQRFGMETLVLFLKGILAFPIIWNFTICFSKLSVLFMYINVIPMRKMKLACRVVGAFIVLWNTGGILGALLLCRPIAKNWDQTIPGTCGDNRLFYIWLGIINVIAEAVILLLPVPFILRLQMKRFKKIVVVGMFSVGWMTCAVTIYRQATLPHLYFEDMTYTGVLATIFTGVEPSVALSVACVPFLRPLLGGTALGKGGTGTGGSSGYAYDSSSRSRRKHGSGSGLGGGGGNSSALRSRQQKEAQNEVGFKELHDDSSEIQLRPVGTDAFKYEADVGPEDNRQPSSESADGIVVKKGWHVVTGTRSAGSS